MSSLGEKEIVSILDKLNVTYEMQFTFRDCKDKRCLPFDFLVIVNGKVGIIEFDGAQHFAPTTKFHGTKDPQKAFEKGVRHDIIKNNYTRNNNISLLRISYKEGDHILKYVTEFITLLKTGTKRVDMFTNKELYVNPYDDPKGFFGRLLALF